MEDEEVSQSVALTRKMKRFKIDEQSENIEHNFNIKKAAAKNKNTNKKKKN